MFLTVSFCFYDTLFSYSFKLYRREGLIIICKTVNISLSFLLEIFLHELDYRNPILVTERLLLDNDDIFPICPTCKITLEREYQHYCDRCGQCLSWRNFSKAKVIYYKDFKK